MVELVAEEDTVPHVMVDHVVHTTQVAEAKGHQACHTRRNMALLETPNTE